MRALITGASGLAGGYLARACARAGDRVAGLSRSGALPDGAGEGRAVDLLDAQLVRDTVRELQPEVVYHLAALSSVRRSWEDPAQTLEANSVGAVNLLEALRFEAPRARVVWVSSCEVYGSAEQLPIDESAPVHPENPYAVSKAAGEMLALMYGEAYELEVIRARPFNHTGPGQASTFIASSLARQAAEGLLAGAQKIEIVTGNPHTRRDFTDVRDIAEAYRVLVERAPPGVYNVCSGQSVSAEEQVELIGELIAPAQIEHVLDPSLVRVREVMDLRGAHDHLSAATGWQPSIPLRQTLAEMIDWWKRELSATRSQAVRD